MIRRVLLSLGVVLLLSLALTGWGSLGIALGLNPESLQTLDSLAPLLAIACAGFWLGLNSSWRAGFVAAFPVLGFYGLMQVFTATRFQLEFWRDGFLQLSFAHLFWWMLAVVIALTGACCGSKAKPRFAAFIPLPLALILVTGAQLATPFDTRASYEADGTSVRLLQFDLRTVDFGVTDADFEDSRPFDNRNTTWLSLAMPRVWSGVASGGEPLCIVNGGFFGADGPLIAQHEAPLKTPAASLYDVSTLQEDWPRQNVTLAWKRSANETKPQILRDASFSDLARFDGALGGVRVLITNGNSEVLKPGMGGTTLKCCRTSVAWNARTEEFWVLGVRDPDGEASSVSGNQIEKKTGRKVQVGGWDVRQVQEFWQHKGATDAVLFDGGESGQIAYRTPEGAWRWIHSSYHLSRTPGFLRGRPLRAVLPMLPPTLANGGVLNWFYIRKKF